MPTRARSRADRCPLRPIYVGFAAPYVLSLAARVASYTALSVLASALALGTAALVARSAAASPHGVGSAIVFFRLTSVELGVFLFAVLLGATGLGIFLGHRVRHLSDSLKEPFGILQGALLGLVGLLLAFGLSLAVSRYEDRRANVVSAANAIGTTYLRAQTLPEPVRSRSLDLLVELHEERPARLRSGAGQRGGT